MKVVLAFLALTLFAAPPVMAGDVSAWTDRCIAGVGQPDNARLGAKSCATVILGYGFFAEDSEACLGAIRTDLPARASEIREGLPRLRYVAPEYRQDHADRLKKATDRDPRIVGAGFGPEPIRCESYVAMYEYTLALDVAEWVRTHEVVE